MNEEPEERQDIYWLDDQEVTVEDFPAFGWILDVGGGGEGVIGRLKGSQVVAIDRMRSELENSPLGPLKIVMDATDLQFLDRSFHTVTAFFSFMFMPASQQPKAFAEIHRILAPGGRLKIWDIHLPTRKDPFHEMVAFNLLINLPGKQIRTGYGTRWPAETQGLAYYHRLAEGVRFHFCTEQTQGEAFYLEFKK